jgi:hypothetical protein
MRRDSSISSGVRPGRMALRVCSRRGLHGWRPSS